MYDLIINDKMFHVQLIVYPEIDHGKKTDDSTIFTK